MVKEEQNVIKGSIDVSAYPVLQDFNSLNDRIKQDNSCSRNYKNHIATWYGSVDYAYTGVRHTAQPLPADFRQVARALEEALRYENKYLNCLLINSYTNKGLSAHSDNEPIFVHKNGSIGAVATVSIGGTANVTITSNDYSTRFSDPYTFSTGHGDVYVMPEGDFQNNYKHAVSRSIKPRISLTFRHLPNG